MPTANAATLAAIDDEQPASVGVVLLRLRAEPAHDADEEPEPAEEADRAGLEQRPEPLVVEDVRVGCRGRSRRRRGCRSPGRAAASACHSCSAGPRSASRPLPLSPGIDCCSATRPPGGRNDCLIAPSVPGSTSLITIRAGISSRPESPRLLRAKPEEDERNDDEHHDPGARDGRRAAGDEQRPRTATSGAGGSAARGRARAASA